MFTRLRKSIAVVGIIITLLSTPALATDFARIGTSSVGGGFYLIGNTIAQVGNAINNGINYSAITGGSTKNLNDLAKGEIEFGMCQSATIDQAIKGVEPFKAPLKSLRFVAAIYPMPCHVLVSSKSGINSVAEFKGKRIDYGPIGAGIETYTRIILNAYDIKDSDVTINRYGKTESTEGLKTGEVDASFWTTTAPNAQVTDMISGGVRLLSIDEDKRQQIIKENPYFALASIPAGTYDNQTADLNTIAPIGVLMSDEKVSEEIVYKTTKALFENSKQLKERLPNYFATFNPERALDGCILDIHSGALKYYKEVGIME